VDVINATTDVHAAICRAPATTGGAPRALGPADVNVRKVGQDNWYREVHDVGVDNFSFAPATVSVPVGTTITWTNHDDMPHQVVSTELKFKSPVLDTDGQFSYPFDAPGKYQYFCSLHPRMTGQIVVR